jgi:quercetin dioxygenase-like cupin family protein
MPLVCTSFLMWGVARSDASSAPPQNAQDGRPSWENNLNWWVDDNAQVYLAALSQPAPTATSTILNRSLLDELGVRVRWGTLRSVVETGRNGQAEVVFQHVVAPPGWSGGWHTHAGVVFVTVADGTLTYYHETDPCHGRQFSKGEGFAEEAHGYDVHIARNEGSKVLDLYLMYVVQKGEALRKDQPAPPGACF